MQVQFLQDDGLGNATVTAGEVQTVNRFTFVMNQNNPPADDGDLLVRAYDKTGAEVAVTGILINKDDGTGEAQAFAANAGIPVLAAIPANEDIRRKSASYEIIGRPGSEWASLFEQLATNVAEAPPQRPKPQTQDELLSLFSSDTVGRNVVLQPATQADMTGVEHVVKQSLEVVYDAV